MKAEGMAACVCTLTRLRLGFGSTDWEEDGHKVPKVDNCKVGSSEHLEANGVWVIQSHPADTIAPPPWDPLHHVGYTGVCLWHG